MAVSVQITSDKVSLLDGPHAFLAVTALLPHDRKSSIKLTQCASMRDYD